MKKLLTLMLLTVLTAALSGCSGGMGGRMFSGCRMFGGNCGQQCNACYQQPSCCGAQVYGQSIPAYDGCCSSCPSCGCGGDSGMVYPGMEMPGMMMPGGMPGAMIQGGSIYQGDQIPVLPGPTPTPSTVPGPTTAPLN